MTLTIDQIVQAAATLPLAQRGELADRIARSFVENPDPEIEGLWIAEALRRRDEVRQGKVKPVPAAAVDAEMKRRIAARQ